MRSKKVQMVAGLIGLASVLGACGDANGTGDAVAGSGDGGALSGAITIDGSSTVFPIAQAVAEEFQIANPNVEVSVGLAGTGGGMEAFCAGDVQIANASRPMEEDEARCLEKNGIEYTELQIAVDGLVVVVHPETDWVDCMTFDQLNEIYRPGTTVARWSEIDPGWPDDEIKIFGPDPDSGTYDYFAEVVADPDADEPSTRDDMTQSSDDNVLVQGVGGEPGSIGYFGYAYYQENADALKVLAVDDGDSGCVTPSPDTVKTNDYPLSRPLFIYIDNAAIARPEVAAFVEHWVAGAADFATAVGYIEAPQDVAAANVQALEDLTG